MFACNNHSERVDGPAGGWLPLHRRLGILNGACPQASRHLPDCCHRFLHSSLGRRIRYRRNRFLTICPSRTCVQLSRRALTGSLDAQLREMGSEKPLDIHAGLQESVHPGG
jgi:hypothetical protein